ncbi:MAG: hypothetical protein KIB43_02920 [Clostridium baratii]|uniref:hypothetical protein n=1 Tax=Clostridium baratii TaxID=1561 RepID=UPI002431BA7A|nr:hypothetical protein [Clostridium baratii]MBS6005888.1 hypothetical protein [Clostridium baratii]
MALEENNCYRDSQSLHDDCKACVGYHVIITMADGSTVDGIIESVDADRVNMLVGEDVMEQEDESKSSYQRQPVGFGRPGRRFRRFPRRSFPLNRLAAIVLLQYPYIMPPFPFFPYFIY